MSTSDAEAFLQRLENDEEFAQRLQGASGDADATHELAVEAGFDFTSEEMVEALGNVYGVELSADQLEQIAAGSDSALSLGASAIGPLSASVVMGAAAG